MSFVKTFMTALLIFIACSSYSQTCNCEKNFEWEKKTFEENDAGFEYIISLKGREAYEIHNKAILAKIKAAKTLSDCTPILYEWLQFFRKGHIGISLTDSMQKILSNNIPVPPSEAIINKQEKITISDAQFAQVIKDIKQPGFEGIWYSAPYTIGIIKQGASYTGFIINAPGTAWKKGQVKLKIFPAEGGFKGTVYMRDFSKQDNVIVDTLGSNFLKVGILNMKRQQPVYEDRQEIQDYVAFLNNSEPYIKKISPTTVYMCIPDFDLSQRKKIDSIVSANDALITSVPNLIIDVRNNGGGADASYRKISPYLYTNPTRLVSVELYSTVLNNKTMLDISNDSAHFTKEEMGQYRELYNKLNNNPGKFVNIFGKDVSIDTMEKVYAYPANVGIIINNGNASTTEQFLLAAKQSKKVKLFGTTTFGALDISNMNYVASPCNEFELGYCRSKSLRIPGLAIDGKGIQPDYFMDNSIPPYKWIEFTEGVLEGK